MTQEFSREIELERVRKKPVEESYEANAVELDRLTARLKIRALERLVAEVRLEEEAPGWFLLQGHLSSRAVQSCIRTLEPVPQELDESFQIRITTDPDSARNFESEGSGDEYEFNTRDVVDVGELIVQQVSMALDPYPRKEDATTPEMEGVEVIWNSDEAPPQPADEARVRPFANLAELLEKKQNN